MSWNSWHQTSNRWQRKVQTSGPSLKLWWYVINTRQKKRWIVKNLKAFVDSHGPNDGHSWHTKQYMYEELTRWGRIWDWRLEKPTRHDHLYNVLGHDNLKLYKGAYEKEIPYDVEAFKELQKTGNSLELKQFWKNIDFTL